MGILPVLRVLTHIWRSQMQPAGANGFLLRTAYESDMTPSLCLVCASESPQREPPKRNEPARQAGGLRHG